MSIEEDWAVAEIRCLQRRVDALERGLRPAATRAIESAAETEVDAEPFDPGEHSVGEVNAYLANAEPSEYQRVVDAERAGKALVRISGIGQEIN